MTKKVGLALGAGSAKGFAHIGVIRALKEEDIPIDCIAGTSMGAIIGSIYACGSDLEFFTKFLHAIEEKRFFDLTTSRKGLISGNRFEELLQVLTKNMDFEDLTFPYCCVACDYEKAKSHIFTTGKIYKAVRCSMSIPGYFEPYSYLNTTFVDGAVIERVPVAACRTLKPDVIIGVDVGYSGGRREKPKNMLDTLKGTFDIMGWEITKSKILGADYMIMPEVDFVDSYSLKQCDECIQAGYDQAKKQIPAIKELLKEQ